MRSSLRKRAAPLPSLLVCLINHNDNVSGAVSRLTTSPANLKQEQRQEIQVEGLPRMSSRVCYALSLKRGTCRTLHRLPSVVLSSMSSPILSCSGGVRSGGHNEHTSLLTPVTFSSTLSSTPDTDTALKELVMDCIPRAPLFAKTTAVKTLVLQYESTQRIWGPSMDVDTQADSIEETQKQPSQSHSSAASRIGGPGGHSSGKKRTTVVSASGFSSSRLHDECLRLIRTRYISFRDMLIAMARERVDSINVKQRDQADEKEGMDEVAIYRGGGRYGIYLSVDLMFVTIASSSLEAGLAFQTAYEKPTEEDWDHMQKAYRDASASTISKKTAAATTQRTSSEKPPSLSPRPEWSAVEAYLDGADFAGTPEDYCYPVLLSDLESTLTPRTWAVKQRSRIFSKTLRLRTGRPYELLVDTCIPYFGGDFTPPPPPCSTSGGASTSTSTTNKKGKGENGAALKPSTNTFAPEQIGLLIPTYFVPIDALLAQLPTGYTAAHVRTIFSETGAVEVVQLGRDTFVRFHGGKQGGGFSKTLLHSQQERFDSVARYDEGADGLTDENDYNNHHHGGNQEEAEMKLRRYIAAFAPDPFLLYAFLPCFTRPYQWVALYDLVQNAPESVKKALLPLRQQHTLLYFAQQQQRMQFTPQNGGAVAMCFPPLRSLYAETTPLPCVLAELRALITNRGVMYVEELEHDKTHALSDYAKRHIIAFFGTLRRFLFQHEPVFRLSVFTSPTTLYEASARKEKEKKERERDADADESIIPATFPSRGDTEKREVEPSLPPLPASLPRPGTGFITGVAPLFSHNNNSTDNAPQHKGGGDDTSSSSGLHADALQEGSFGGACREDAQLDAEGFPRWLASRDLAVQLEEEAKLRDHYKNSLEEQLEAVETARSRVKVRKLRRRLAAIANPNSPFSDPAVLLDAIIRYLPPTRHVSLRALLAALPMSMRDFLPNDPVRLFRNNPDKVQLFEYRCKNHLRVMRPGLPLPDGRLRASYTEEELLHLIAAQLPPGQVKCAMTLYGNLPYGARETVRLQYHHLVTLAERYPQYFVVVYTDAKKDLKHLVRISLLQPPPPPQDWTEDVALTSSMTTEELEAVEKADRAALLAELSPELRETLDANKSS